MTRSGVQQHLYGAQPNENEPWGLETRCYEVKIRFTLHALKKQSWKKKKTRCVELLKRDASVHGPIYQRSLRDARARPRFNPST